MKRVVLLLSVFAVITSNIVLAGTTGKLAGKVTDAKTKEPLPAVNVVIVGTAYGAATDASGNYVILNIPPGNYTVRAAYLGYRAEVVENVSISIDATTKLDFFLSESAVQLQAVVVEGKRDIIKMDLTSSQATVSAEKISTLPVAEFDQVLQLQAGITRDAGGGFHIRGGRTSEIAYWVNGVSITDPYDNSRGLDIDNSSIQEMQVISGTFNAEYGNAMSGIVNTVTKEGGKDFHGSLGIYSGDYVSGFTSYFPNVNHYNPFTNYNFQGNLSGPVPFTSELVAFFVSGRYVYDDGYLYGLDNFNVDGTPGSGRAVAMNWSKRWLGQGNLAYRPIENMKINVDLLYSRDDYQDLNGDTYSFKWDPGGSPFKYARSYDGTITVNHFLSSRTFYTFRANYFFKNFNQYVFPSAFDSRYLSPDSLTTVGYAFHTKGADLHRFFRETQSYTGKLDFSSQVTDNHLLQFGAEAKTHRLKFDDYTLEPLTVNNVPVVPFQPAIPGPTSINRNLYNANPVEFSSYVQDKIEYKNVIINVGLRLDYFDSRGKVLVDQQDPNIYVPLRLGLDSLTVAQRESYFYKDATAKWQLSPRFGISYPISESGVIHFSYGHFLQVPTFQYLFNGGQYKVPETGSVGNPFGNPDLQPQRTIMYEIGFRQQFLNNYVIDVTGFYRDIRDWVTTSPPIATLNGVTYSFYINQDYSNVRGITLNFSRSFSDHFSIDLNYTYQVAEGSNSNPDDAFRAAQNNQAPVIFLSPLNWDQRDNLNVNILVGGKDWDVSLLGRYGTGLPYTPSVTQYTSDRGLSTGFETNSRYRPAQLTFDLYANKNFHMFGTELTAYLKIFNLLDAHNVVNVWTDTGEPNFTTSVNGLGEDPQRPNSIAEYIRYPWYYAAPRLVQTGIRLSF
ncbi:MAG: TonB-dependent receptor [Bacteroidetes bacterium]|jgi:outer membrane receptor protein involved in Fe transport|nr:TonB-dependent receptor [Bacteroidota bacterium]MCL5033984.1 TonB-dependent receptor [Bacteroidota bacterium]